MHLCFHPIFSIMFPQMFSLHSQMWVMKWRMRWSCHTARKKSSGFRIKSWLELFHIAYSFPPNLSPPPGNRNMFLCWCGRLTVMGPWTFTPHLFRPRRVTQLQTKKPGLIPRLCASWWLKHWQPKSQPPLRGHRQVGVPDCLSYGSPPFRLDTLLCPAVWLAAWDLLSSV